MSRKKRKNKANGSAKSTPHRAPSKRPPSPSWPVAEATAAAPKFSLVDEARWISRHRTAAFEAGKKLRHMPLHFISAGCLQGTIEERTSAPAVERPEPTSDTDSPAPSSLSSPLPISTEAMAHMAIRSPSPVASDVSSSTDVVVFHGRGQTPLPSLRPEQVSHGTPPLTIDSTDDRLIATDVGIADPSECSIVTNATSQPEQDGHSDADSVVQDLFEKRREGKPVWEGQTTKWQHRSKVGVGWLPVDVHPRMESFLRGDVNTRDAAMDDYMQNVEHFAVNTATASGFTRRELDLDAGNHNDWESVLGSQEETDNGAYSHDSWDSEMLRDFEGVSTSSDVLDTVVRILAKRSRRRALQYLCVYDGSVTEDARWLPATFLKSVPEQQLVQAFEAKLVLQKRLRLDCSTSASEDEDENEDEKFNDEHIARVLQKQEELGLGSDEMLLFAGDEAFGNPLRHETFFVRPSKKRQSRLRGKHDPVFPSASAMADALAMDPYNGYDIMDTERPSLRCRKKGRRGQMPPELEDSDLNEQLQSTWAADRARKRLKKAGREKLRHQGLLGEHANAPNLTVKYKGGIGVEDIVEEIREFLTNDMLSLSLPPMEAGRRAALHQAAVVFDLNSRSRGNGSGRFTVLSKTSRTRTLAHEEFNLLVHRKGLFRRLHGHFHGSDTRVPKGISTRHGPRLRPQLGYKDGETVGADAPELGPENKGHALITKMGWSKGMGLGALDNTGILQPIPHTVKISKAGLQ